MKRNKEKKKYLVEICQFVIGIILRLLLRIFWLFPIKGNRVFFTSFKGEQYSCNPKYLYEYMREHCENMELIWGVRRKIRKGIPADVCAVNFFSIRGMYYCMTSKVIVDNFAFFPYIPYRKKQYCINTWHGGGAYKKIDNKTLHKSKYKIWLDKRKAMATDLYVLSCRKAEMVAESLLLGRKVQFAETGMPRNDLLFDQVAVERAKEKVKSRLGIGADERIVLYAPTFRGEEKGKDKFTPELEITELVSALNKRYGCRFRMVVRAHHCLVGRLKLNSAEFTDASGYPDVMELLCAADVLVTDYSSVMWDFAILKKPIYLFVPDLDSYRGFYVDIHQWHFPLARDMREMCHNIENLTDNMAIKNAEQHLQEFESFERGEACQKISRIIEMQMKGHA